MTENNSENLSPAPPAFVDRDDVVERYRPYVYSIVKQIRQSFSVPLDFEEMVSYGFIGLLEAADRYDARRKVSFLTFSYYRIRGAVFDGLREMGVLNRIPKSVRIRREAALNDLAQTAADDNSESPSSNIDDEIFQVEQAVDALIPAYLLSLSDENAPDLPDKAELADVRLEYGETLKLVRQAVTELSPKEREIIESLYFKHFSTTALAQKMGVNKSWISRLHTKAIASLRRRLDEIGIISGGKSP